MCLCEKKYHAPKIVFPLVLFFSNRLLSSYKKVYKDIFIFFDLFIVTHNFLTGNRYREN